MSKPRTLLFDIETSANLGYVWDKWETNVIEFNKEWDLLSFAWKWADEKKVSCLTRADFKDKTDKSLAKALWSLLDEADIVIAHNGKSFDVKKSNARFLSMGLPPPSPYTTIDTKLEARKYFKFNSNSLDDLGKTLGLGRKIKHSGFSLWLRCMAGERAAFKEMARYNRQDIVLLEQVYNKLLPWMTNVPNTSNRSPDKPEGCPKCGSSRLKSRGFRHTKTTSYRQYICLSCNSYCRATTAEKVKKPKVVTL